MAKRRRKRNPVNLDRYGDLFYDAAASFNEFVDELITVAFNVDRTNEKISRKMVKAAAVAIIQRWEQIARVGNGHSMIRADCQSLHEGLVRS